MTRARGGSGAAPPGGDRNPESVLARANLLLGAFGPRHRYLSLSDLVVRTGLPKSTVHRTAQQMRDLGWLVYHDTKYSLGIQLFELAGLVAVRHELRETVFPFMADLYETTRATVHLGVRVQHEVLYVEKLAGHDRVIDESRVGGRLPLYRTGIGKVLLAFSSEAVLQEVLRHGMTPRTSATIVTESRLRRELAEVVEFGVAFDREESVVGVACVAAPIYGPDRTVVAAISVTGRANNARLHRLAPVVANAARGASRALTMSADVPSRRGTAARRRAAGRGTPPPAGDVRRGTA